MSKLQHDLEDREFRWFKKVERFKFIRQRDKKNRGFREFGLFTEVEFEWKFDK
jgi:hypothetical protein